MVSAPYLVDSWSEILFWPREVGFSVEGSRLFAFPIRVSASIHSLQFWGLGEGCSSEAANALDNPFG